VIQSSARDHAGDGKREHGSAYAFFYRGKWRVNPPITHPPFCVCKRCRRSRPDDQWDRATIVRIDRVSKYQNEPQAIAYAYELKRTEEERLQVETGRAREELRALGSRKTLGQICDAYRAYQRSEGKRLDRDESRIAAIENFFGDSRDPEQITKADLKEFQQWLTNERGCAAATIDRHTTVLVALLNHAVREELIASHQLKALRRPRVKRCSRPKTFSPAQISVLLGAAMDRFETWQKEQFEKFGAMRVPLRGFVLIAYKTMMRPSNNFHLRWEQLTIDRELLEGSFRLTQHKNSSRGFDVEGPLAPTLVRYLVTTMPAGTPTGFVHINAATGQPFKSIRGAWRRLIALANEILPTAERIGPELRFYSLRHSAASALCASGADPVAVVRLMGDRSLATVMKHYFNSDDLHLKQLVTRWDAGTSAGAPR
jgi:integrase